MVLQCHPSTCLLLWQAVLCDVVDLPLVQFDAISIDVLTGRLYHNYDQYTLKELANNAGIKNDFTHLPAHEVAKGIVKKYLDADSSYILQSNIEVHEWEHGLTDCVIRKPQRPDVCVRHNGNIVLVIEAHSGKSEQHFYMTVRKTAYALLSQLRYLRQQYDIDRVVGFTFPKQDFPAVVVKVAVFGFYCEVNAVQVKQVGQEVRDAVDGVQRCLVQSSTTACGPFRLTQEDLRTINHILTTVTTKQHKIRFCLDHGNDEQLEQLNSRSSLILVRKRNTYKHICQGVSSLLRDLFEIAQSEQLVTVIGYFALGRTHFQVFPTVLRPLTNEEAKPCLLHLVEDVKMALEELHSLGYAHLDVRLDNICLKKTQDGLMAVLIDFDFTMETEQAMEKRGLVRRSNMYRIPDFKDESYSQNAEKFDWWQLGLLVAYCLTVHHCSVRPDYHKFEIPKELCQYEFFKCAQKGEPSSPRECERIAECSDDIKYLF